MALTKDQAAEKVIARLVQKGEKTDGLLKPDITSWIDEALQRLARNIADGPEYAELQKEIILDIIDGSSTISDTSILVDTIGSTGLVLLNDYSERIVSYTNGAIEFDRVSGPSFLGTADISKRLFVLGAGAVGLNLTLAGSIVGSPSPGPNVVFLTVAATATGSGNSFLAERTQKVAKWKPRYEAMLVAKADDIAHFSLRGKTLYFKTAAGVLVFSSTATVLANFVPTLGAGTASDLPMRFENQLIDVLIQMYTEKKHQTPPPLIPTGE